MRRRIIHTQRGAASLGTRARRSNTRAALLAGLGLLACSCAHGPSTDAAPARCEASFDRAAVVAVLDAQREAWNAGDLDGFLAGYERSEALLFTSGAKIRRGYEQTATKYRARYGEASETMGTLAFEILDVRALGSCADAAVVLGRWAVSESEQAGSGVFSVILERDGEGRWLLVHDHTSADPKPGT